MRIAFLLIFSLVFLSSCMKLDSHFTIDPTGGVRTVATLDMSQMVALIASLESSTSSGSVDKNLCNDINLKDGLNEGLTDTKNNLKNVKCTPLGDYKAQIEGDMNLKNTKGALFLSGVTIIDLLAFGKGTGKRSQDVEDDLSDATAEEMGFSIRQSYTLPGTIVYREAGTLSGTSHVALNLLDPKLPKKKSIIVISTSSGTRLSQKEINSYKLQLKKHNRKVR